MINCGIVISKTVYYLSCILFGYLYLYVLCLHSTLFGNSSVLIGVGCLHLYVVFFFFFFAFYPVWELVHTDRSGLSLLVRSLFVTQVESNLPFMSGAEMIEVLPRQSVPYTYTLSPRRRGVYQGVIAFIATQNYQR
jgi:hypothetical protein